MDCDGNRLANVSYYTDVDGTRYTIGTLEICVNGTYYPSCLDSLPNDTCSSLNHDDSGELTVNSCHQIQKWNSRVKIGKKNVLFHGLT